jgi:hypothetical protein
MASRMIITVADRHRRLLGREARRLGISRSELVRRCIDNQLGPNLDAVKQAYLSIVALGEGDGAEVARRHHEAVREAFARPRGRFR